MFVSLYVQGMERLGSYRTPELGWCNCGDYLLALRGQPAAGPAAPGRLPPTRASFADRSALVLTVPALKNAAT